MSVWIGSLHRAAAHLGTSPDAVAGSVPQIDDRQTLTRYPITNAYLCRWAGNAARTENPADAWRRIG